jgi:hypothetical protein
VGRSPAVAIGAPKQEAPAAKLVHYGVDVKLSRQTGATCLRPLGKRTKRSFNLRAGGEGMNVPRLRQLLSGVHCCAHADSV